MHFETRSHLSAFYFPIKILSKPALLRCPLHLPLLACLMLLPMHIFLMREANLSMRETSLLAREGYLSMRETGLLAREGYLLMREASLLAPEGYLSMRETSLLTRERHLSMREAGLLMRENHLSIISPVFIGYQNDIF